MKGEGGERRKEGGKSREEGGEEKEEEQYNPGCSTSCPRAALGGPPPPPPQSLPVQGTRTTAPADGPGRSQHVSALTQRPLRRGWSEGAPGAATPPRCRARYIHLSCDIRVE